MSELFYMYAEYILCHNNFVLYLGSAGAVVANRLSEIKHWRILLLEAGPDENEISDVSNVKCSHSS